jgi:pimeloyl-ACP methyl ester carboxylesterase
MLRHSLIALAFVSVALLGESGMAQPQAQPAPQAAAAKNDYGKPESWLCRPGRQDACAVDMTATVVTANGKLTRETWAADAKAPVDCFYVYPTVSGDPTPNSDMNAGPEELNVIRQQFARFASVCRVYAPLYRQVTLTALRAALTGKPMAADRALAYNDVADAWRYYLEHDNQGRGVVLVGHSQGSGVLTQLIRNEIDGKPAAERLVSALLMGTNLPVPKGKDVGGAFQHVPLCRTASQTGCVVAYASFRADAPPPSNSRFGRVQGEGMVAACVNPAAPGGGSGELHAYLTAAGQSIVSAAEPKPWVTPPQPITTAFVSVPGLLTAECVANDKGSYLAVSVHGNPEDPRTDEIAGDVVVNGQVLADWGLHLIDVNLAIGNLIDMVRQQGKAYLAAHKKK